MVRENGLTTTTWLADLPPNAPGKFYAFRVTARDEDRQRVGALGVRFDGGRWREDFRFTVGS